MIALTIIGILAAVVLPGYFAFIQNTRAAQAVADLQAVRAAVYLYYGDLGRWPRESQAGFIPAGVAPNLPKDFTFRRKWYTIDYDNWVPLHRRGAAPAGIATAVGVSVISRDPAFLKRVAALLKGVKFTQVSRTKYILEIATMEGF
jgi:type II secretory pathway pseudopilin PulG